VVQQVMNVLLAILMFFIATTLISLAVRGKEIRFGKHRLSFVIGGVLLFVGTERVPRTVKPINRGLSYAMIASVFIGIALFYASFLPMMIRFIASFVGSALGMTHATPKPVVVPVPLLFQYTSIIPYILLGIGTAIVFHEIAHAVVALREGIPVKSWGIGVFLLVPIAFVELEDEKFLSASRIARLKVVSAGVFSNMVVAIAAFLVMTLLSHTVLALASPAIMVKNLCCSICVPPCPSKLAGIQPGDIITAIDGHAVHSLEDLVRALSKHRPNETVDIMLCRPSGACRVVTLRLSSMVKNKSRPCIGVELVQSFAVFRGLTAYIPQYLSMVIALYRAMFYVFIINYSLFALNSIPLIITDGTKFLDFLVEGRRFESFFKRRYVDIVNAVVIAIAMTVSTYLLLVR